LETRTIYSADNITAPVKPGVKAGDRVILKGKTVAFPKGFQWPLGAALNVESVVTP
jgi:hypothetical protein